MIAELRWESNRYGKFGHSTEWRLMAGKLWLANVVPGNGTGRWCVIHYESGDEWFESLKEAKRAVEKLAGVGKDARFVSEATITAPDFESEPGGSFAAGFGRDE